MKIPSPPPDQGSLADVYVAEVLAGLYRHRRTGILRLEKEPFVKILYVHEGSIAYASSNAQFDRLGEVLVRHGMLTPEQLEDANRRVEGRVSLGKVLVQLGYLSPKELLQGARLQVLTVTDSIFQWDEGTYRFAEGAIPKQVVNLHIPMPRVVLEGCAHHASVDWVRQFIPEGHTACASLTESFYQVQPELEIPSNIEEVFGWLDGQKTLEEIARQTSLSAFFVAKVIAALYVLGLADIQVQPLEEPVEVTPAAEPEKAPAPEPSTPLEPKAERPLAPPEPVEAPPSIPPVVIPQGAPDAVTGIRGSALPRRRYGLLVGTLVLLALGIGMGALWLWWQRQPLLSEPTAPAPIPDTQVHLPVPPESPPEPVEIAPETGSVPSSEPTAPPPEPLIASAIRSDQPDQAVQASVEWFQRQAMDAWTVQVELACRWETVQKALGEVQAPDRLYVLPKRFRGRLCWIVGYGVFANRQRAEEARARELSSYLLHQPSPPRVITVAQMTQLADLPPTPPQ